MALRQAVTDPEHAGRDLAGHLVGHASAHLIVCFPDAVQREAVHR
jgi:hypothetical protein